MRSVVLDVETTGLEVSEGHRIVAIGLVEIDEERLIRTGEEFDRLVNPERRVGAEALEVHGLDDEMLQSQPNFEAIAEAFLDFVGDSRLIIHNAAFDMGFVNAELERARREIIGMDRVVDTLELAKSGITGLSRFNLDALCRHFEIDNRERAERHGALLDARLLAEVFFCLKGKSRGMFGPKDDAVSRESLAVAARQRPEKLPPRLTEAERRNHAAHVAALGGNCLWKELGA